MNDFSLPHVLLSVLCGAMAGAAGFAAIGEDAPAWRTYFGATCGINVVAAVWLIIKGVVLLLATS